MKKFNLSGRRQFKKELLIANQKLRTDVNRGVCYPRLRDFFTHFFVLQISKNLAFAEIMVKKHFAKLVKSGKINNAA